MSLDEHSVVERVSRVTLRELRLWVREGWVRPARGEAGPVFDDIDVARVRLLCELRKDMSISRGTLPVVLTLIDNLNRTRRDLRNLTEALQEQPEDVRRAVTRSLERRLGRREKSNDD
jgi:chaperone modulatory protein CbpM